MKITAAATGDEILAELGARLRAYRLQQNRSLADVAEQAGLQKLTVQNAELGRGSSLDSFIKILRALGRLDAIDAFLPVPLVSPLDLARRAGRVRQRAGTPRQKRRDG